MTKKITKKDRFNALLEMAEVRMDADMVAFITHEIELLDRKNSGERKPSKTQQENEGLKEIVLSVASEEPMTVSDFIKAHVDLCGLSNQKVAALVKALVNDGKLIKTTEKGRSYFTKA